MFGRTLIYLGLAEGIAIYGLVVSILCWARSDGTPAMAAETEPLSRARLLFFGERALTEGYGLIGFETFPDATVEQARPRAHRTAADPRHRPRAARPARRASGQPHAAADPQEGGRILVTEVPSLRSPEDYHSDIDDQVSALLGGGTLEDR